MTGRQLRDAPPKRLNTTGTELALILSLILSECAEVLLQLKYAADAIYNLTPITLTSRTSFLQSCADSGGSSCHCASVSLTLRDVPTSASSSWRAKAGSCCRSCRHRVQSLTQAGAIGVLAAAKHSTALDGLGASSRTLKHTHHTSSAVVYRHSGTRNSNMPAQSSNCYNCCCYSDKYTSLCGLSY